MPKLANAPSIKIGKDRISEIVASDYKFGPAMRGLTERQRRFVIAMVEYPMASQAAAASMAGYAGPLEDLSTHASRMAHDPRISAAIREEAQARLGGAGILASTKVVQLLNDSTDPTIILKCASMIFDRIGMPKQTKQEINVNHGLDTGGSAVDRIAKACILLGVDPKTLLGRAAPPDAIDAEFTEVDDGSEGLEDVLG
jgi:hypothetical protein